MPASSALRFRRFSWWVLGFTLAVILWGAFVRATGSGAGCGEHWPACNGQVVPRAPTVATLIEFTHRLTSGAVLILTLVLFFWGRRLYGKGHPVRLGVSLSLFFMITEALVGAGLVLFALVAKDVSFARAVGMSVHLVNTFFLVAALTLTTRWAGGGERVVLRRQGGLMVLLLASAVALLLLGISGAITALGDTLFPTVQGVVVDPKDMSVAQQLFFRLRFLHPVLAVVLGGLALVSAFVAARLRPTASIRKSAHLLGALYGLQLLVGLLNVQLLAPVSVQLLHLLLADCVWMVFVQVTAKSLSLSAPRRPWSWSTAKPAKLSGAT